MNNYLVLDIENDNTNRYKRTAGNFLYDKIVAIGAKYKDVDANSWCWVGGHCTIPSFDFIELVVGHNIKHDLLFLWKIPQVQAYLKNGGKIWCTQLAEYYLTSFQNKYPALRDIAVNKYRCKDRVKHLDNLLFNIPEKQRTQYKQVSDLPKELVLEDVRNDVLDTESIYLQQVEKAKQLGILDVLEINMEYLLCTTEMEFNGFFTDLKTLQKNRDELLNKLGPIQAEFDALVNEYIPIDAFKNQPKKGLELLFFGGQLRTVEKRQMLDENGLPVMVKSGQKIGHSRFKNEEQIIDIKGLGLKPLGHWKTEKGNISIDESVLQEILSTKSVASTPQQLDACTISELLLEKRNIEKQISTYFDAIEELVYDIDSCIHGKFHHTATGTGRLSSSDPNQQNLPRSSGSTVKEQFRSRY